MDGERFDDLIRRICTTRLTRISALRGLAAGAAAALTGATLASDDTVAKKGGKGRQKGNKGKTKGRGKSNRRLGAEQVASDCPTPIPPDPVPFPGRGPDECPTNGDIPDGGCCRVNEPPADCRIFTGSCGCHVEVCVSADRKELSFGPVEDQPVCAVSGVVVKGGILQHEYAFDPPLCCAQGLVSPRNQGGEIPAISHYDLCDVDFDCCEPADLCEEEPCTCITSTGRCRCKEVICEPANLCETEPCICDPDDGSCDCTPVVCEPANLCETTPCVCDPSDGDCDCTPVVCEPANLCEVAPCVCDPDDGSCDCTPVVCEPPDFCKVNCRCEVPGGCICDDRVCPDEPGCVTLGCIDGACRYDCPEECSSCTIGYYSQNQCRVDVNVKLPCAADSAIGKKCFKKYGQTLKGLLTARGGDVICAQAAAAYLNQVEFGEDSCTDGIDICTADNATLSAANEQGDCPLQGCGRSDNRKKRKR